MCGNEGRRGHLKGLRSSLRLNGTSSRFSGASSRRGLLQGASSRLSGASSRWSGASSRWTSFKERTKVYEEDGWRPPEAKKNWWHAVFVFSLVSLFVCLLQMFLPPPYGFRMTSREVADVGVAPDGCDDGLERCICPRATVCATDVLSMALLACARCTAFFDYPLYAMMFLSKAHNLNNILRRTVLREWIDFADMHHVHALFGKVIGVEAMSHSLFHIVRWAINGDIRLLWETGTGVSGFVAMACTPLIVWPMFVPRLKAHLRFEVRKGLHYLSYFWAVSLMWHAPSRIFYVIGVPFLLYLLDYLVGLFLRNHLIENVHFERYGEGGVALHFENPKGFDSQKTSYVYIMCPWISKWQWHAFTAFPEPKKENHTMLCINAGGDWTRKLHEMIKSPCLRSVYITGPFASEFSDLAVSTTNAIAIASGIGITPTLSLMLAYAGKKRVNVLWMCRDAGLIEYLLHKVDIHSVTKNSFVLIFYTGKRELVLPKLPANFFIFRSRPNLEETISGVIAAIQSGDGLPEEMYENQRALASIPFHERIKFALGRITSVYSKEEMFQYSVKATDAELDREPKMIARERTITRQKSSRNLALVSFADTEDETRSSGFSRGPQCSRVSFADTEDKATSSGFSRGPQCSRVSFADTEDKATSSGFSRGPQSSRASFADTEDEATSSSYAREPQMGDSLTVLMNSFNEGSENNHEDPANESRAGAEAPGNADGGRRGDDAPEDYVPDSVQRLFRDHDSLLQDALHEDPANDPDKPTTTRVSFASNEVESTSSDEVSSDFIGNLNVTDANNEDESSGSVEIFSAVMNNLNESSGTNDEYPDDDPEKGALIGTPDNVVSVTGLEAMIYQFLGGIGEYDRSDIENLFRLVDTDDSGYIDEEEFETFLDLAIGEKHCDDKSARVLFGLNMSLTKNQQTMDIESSGNAKKKDLMIGDASTLQSLEEMARDAEKPLDDWSMFYCGASTPIEKALKGISKKYSIDLGVEKFNW